MSRAPHSDRWRQLSLYRADLISLVGLVALAVVFLSPALRDGPTFGPFDFDLSLTPLTQGLFSSIHSPYNGDAVSQMIAWNALDWHMVHAGHFPLWNSYSVLGMPQFFNFESSVLSLPDLVSYLVPLNWAFTVVVFVKLVIAATGAYVFGRVLGLGRIASFFAGASFCFSGAFASWVTWPLSDVASWSGWIFAFLVLAYRSPRARNVLGLAVAIAFSVYGGFPEANVMVAIVLVAAGVVVGFALALSSGLSVGGIGRVSLGGVAGVALSAPLWLPGLHVISGAHRITEGSYAGLPLRALPLLFSQGYYGLPIGPSPPPFQLLRWNYYETVSYVGPIVLVLALVAILRSRQRVAVAALTMAAVVAGAFVYEPAAFHPVQSLVDHVHVLAPIRFERMRIVLDFLLAMLAALGLDALIRRGHERATRMALFAASLAVAAAVGLSLVAASHAGVTVRSARLHALLWPVVLAAGMVLGAAVALWWSSVRLSVLAVPAAAASVAFCFFAGIGIYSYAPAAYPSTAATAKLASVLGGRLVALDGGNSNNVRAFAHLGFYPNVNLGYGVRLFAVHDPMVPIAYFASWPIRAAAPSANGVGLFVPDVDSVALAHRYGIGYVLVAPGLPAPKGMRLVATIRGERLMAVPGSSPFSLARHGASLAWQRVGDGGGFVVDEAAAHPTTLVARITDEPGWHVTLDGRPVPFTSYDDVMMQLRVPAGRHVVDFSYWPARYSEGLALAAIAAVCLLAYACIERGRSRTSRAKKEDAWRSVDNTPGGEE